MKQKSSSKSAFFNPRALVGFGLCLIGLLLALLAYTAYPGASLLAQKPSQQTIRQWQPRWVVAASSHNDVSLPLRELASLPLPPSQGKHERPENARIPINHTRTDRPDPVVQNKFLSGLTVNIPGPILNFPGIVIADSHCSICSRPDTNGAVGLTQYVQIVNGAYQVFNKFTAVALFLHPVAISSI
jgi:hypothetical protein